MDSWITTLLTWLLTQGWPGLIIILLLAFGAALFQDMRNELKGTRARIENLQDVRVDDAKKITAETVESIQSVRAAVSALGDLIRDRQGRA